MVIDTSALIAILEQEPDARLYAEAIRAASLRLISTASVVEAGVVVTVRHGEATGADLDLLIHESAIHPVPVTAEHARLARTAYARFGKGRHPAGLNFGDCFPYALAKATGYPLLFKGDDFARTDLPAAPHPKLH